MQSKAERIAELEERIAILEEKADNPLIRVYPYGVLPQPVVYPYVYPQHWYRLPPPSHTVWCSTTSNSISLSSTSGT